MKLERLALGVAVLALVATIWCALEIRELQARLGAASEQSRSTRGRRSAALAATNVEARLQRLEAIAPGLGAVMAHAQMHFAKLYYAAEARNWELARFERVELIERFDTVAALQPQIGTVNLVGVLDAFKQTQLTALQDAIDMKDRGLFREAYRESVAMCNACHQSTGHPYIVITIPTNPPVANQQWEPVADQPK